ncbi:hypothetical protein Tco_0337662 [Tanacetum coccineum]
MVKEGIVLGHKISKSGIEVDKAKVDVIAKLPHPTTVKGIRGLGLSVSRIVYARFIQIFSKIAPAFDTSSCKRNFVSSSRWNAIGMHLNLKMKLTLDLSSCLPIGTCL